MLRGLHLRPGLPKLLEVLPVRGVERRGRLLHLDVPADGHAAGLEEVGVAHGAVRLPGCGGDDPMTVPGASEIPLLKPREPLPWVLPPHPTYHGIEDGIIDLGEDPAGDDMAEVVRPASNPRVE